MTCFSHSLKSATACVALLAALAIARPARAFVPRDGQAELVLVAAPSSYLGVKIRDLDPEAARALGLKSTRGVEVVMVDRDSPAGKAGIRLRDAIVAVDGQPVTDAHQFRATMAAFPPGKEIVLTLIRDGKPAKFTVRLADRAKLQQQAWLEHFNVPMPEMGSSFSGVTAAQRQLSLPDVQGAHPDPVLTRPYRIGAELEAIGPQLAAYFGVKEGTGMLVRNVVPDSPAAAAGLLAGDVIVKLNDDSIVTPMDWMRAIETAEDKPLQLTVVRNKRVEIVTVAQPKTQARIAWPTLP